LRVFHFVLHAFLIVLYIHYGQLLPCCPVTLHNWFVYWFYDKLNYDDDDYDDDDYDYDESEIRNKQEPKLNYMMFVIKVS